MLTTQVPRRQAGAKFSLSFIQLHLTISLQKAFADAVATVKNAKGRKGKHTFKERLDFESFALDDDDPSLEAALAAYARLGKVPAAEVMDGGLDANWLTFHGYPTVTLPTGHYTAAVYFPYILPLALDDLTDRLRAIG